MTRSALAPGAILPRSSRPSAFAPPIVLIFGESVRRDEWPEAPVVDRVLLARLRDEIEDAVARAEKLRSVTDRLLRELHEKRRTHPGLNRRRGDR